MNPCKNLKAFTQKSPFEQSNKKISCHSKRMMWPFKGDNIVEENNKNTAAETENASEAAKAEESVKTAETAKAEEPAKTAETAKAEEPAKTVETAKAEKAPETEDEKKIKHAIVFGIVAIVFLAGTKLIFGTVFCYIVALILALIGLRSAYKTTEFNKKAALAMCLTAMPAIIAGYNLLGIGTRDIIIDTAYHQAINGVKRDMNRFNNTIQNDLNDIEIRLNDDLSESRHSNAYNYNLSSDDLKKLESAAKQDGTEFKEKAQKNAAKINEEAAKAKQEIEARAKSNR